jgi:hypothetical protein
VAHPVPGPAGEQQLAGYLLLDPGTTAAQVHAFAGMHLPGYMVPAHLVVLDAFPRLPNGKVDRSALLPPEPGRATLTPYAAPADRGSFGRFRPGGPPPTCCPPFARRAVTGTRVRIGR